MCLGLLAVGLVSCDQDPTIHGDYSVSLLVYGTVSDGAGQPIVGTNVRAFAHRNNDCNNPSFMSGMAATNALGKYQIEMSTLGRAFTACVMVSPSPEPPAPFIPPKALGVQVKETHPPDSLKADFVSPEPG